jgi:hypothetical protein
MLVLSFAPGRTPVASAFAWKGKTLHWCTLTYISFALFRILTRSLAAQPASNPFLFKKGEELTAVAPGSFILRGLPDAVVDGYQKTFLAVKSAKATSASTHIEHTVSVGNSIVTFIPRGTAAKRLHEQQARVRAGVVCGLFVLGTNIDDSFVHVVVVVLDSDVPSVANERMRVTAPYAVLSPTNNLLSGDACVTVPAVSNVIEEYAGGVGIYVVPLTEIVAISIITSTAAGDEQARVSKAIGALLSQRPTKLHPRKPDDLVSILPPLARIAHTGLTQTEPGSPVPELNGFIAYVDCLLA